MRGERARFTPACRCRLIHFVIGVETLRMLPGTLCVYPQRRAIVAVSIVRFRRTDPFFEGPWSPEEHYLDDWLSRQYARALYFALAISYGNDMSKFLEQPLCWERRLEVVPQQPEAEVPLPRAATMEGQLLVASISEVCWNACLL